MAHASDLIPIDPALHTDLRRAVANHPAAQIGGSPLATALKADTGDSGQIMNSALTAFLSALHQGPLNGVAPAALQDLVARAAKAFPGR
jgi:hypothetical protein